MKKMLLLLSLPFLLAGCKKDSKPFIFTGIVLNNTTHTPVAGAEVSLQFVNFNANNYDFPTYKAITDAKGFYTVEVTDIGNRGEYYIISRKAKTVQLYNYTFGRRMIPPYRDTVLVDDAAYVSMTLKVAPKEGSSAQFLVWELLAPFDDRTDMEVSLWTGKKVILGNLPEGTTINTLDSFAYVDHTKVFVNHFIGALGGDKVLDKKIVPLRPHDTTHIAIQ